MIGGYLGLSRRRGPGCCSFVLFSMTDWHLKLPRCAHHCDRLTTEDREAGVQWMSACQHDKLAIESAEDCQKMERLLHDNSNNTHCFVRNSVL